MENVVEKDYLHDRVLFLFGEVNQETVTPLIQQIIEINQFDSEHEAVIKNHERKPIKLFIDTPGGCVFAGNSLISVMLTNTTPITTIALGSVMSMGLAIFAAGDIRETSPLTTFMFHGARFGAMGSTGQILDELESVENLSEMYNNLLLSRTDFPEEIMEEYENANRNYYFYAADALDYGVATTLMGVSEEKFLEICAQIEEESQELIEEETKQEEVVED